MPGGRRSGQCIAVLALRIDLAVAANKRTYKPRKSGMNNIDRISHRALLSAAALALAIALSACGQGTPQQQAAPPPPAVTVENPVKRMVTDSDEYVGRFVAIDSVELRARVSGYLDKVHFTDGQLVKEGDLLFTIDRRPFQYIMEQARANLALARANLAYADADLERGQALVKEKTITEQTYQQRMQAKRTAEAQVAANEALLRQAELDHHFSEIRAPVSGRIGDRRVSPGNLVIGGAAGGASATLLATIVSYDPIRFEFTMDESSYLRYERNAMKGTDVASRGSGIPVSLRLIDEKEFTNRGQMDFIDNAIDRSSGTIRGRAVFRNLNGIFAPGMFGRIQVTGSAPYEALLVPDVAIGTEQIRKFVLVVGPDNVVSQRFVTLGQLVDGMRVIKDGLTAADRVIVNGLMRARPGQKVTPQQNGVQAPQAKAAGSAEAKN
jgi:RND family efflux transporter MFP subunit